MYSFRYFIELICDVNINFNLLFAEYKDNIYIFSNNRDYRN